MANENNTKDREIIMSRVLHAPRELVYKVWTSPEHMPHWWGPNGFKNTLYEMDVREGGVCRYTMHGPDGTDFPNYMRYTKVIPNERLEYLHGDVEGTGELHFQVTTTFEDAGEQTKVTMKTVFATAEEKQRVVDEFGAAQGAIENMNCAEDYIAFLNADSTFTISRVFDAPIDLLYEVHTKAEHLAHFWGPKECENKIIEFDFRTGGKMMHSMEMEGASTMYGQHLYREIDAPNKITLITTFCDKEGNMIRQPMSDTWPVKMLNSMTFEKVSDDKTKLTIKGVPFEATAEEHKTYLEGHDSMRGGYGGTFEVLESYLTTLKK